MFVEIKVQLLAQENELSTQLKFQTRQSSQILSKIGTVNMKITGLEVYTKKKR